MNMIAKKFPAAALIDGQWITSAKTFSVSDPATGAEVATVPDLGAKYAVMQAAMASAERIYGLLGRPPVIVSPSAARSVREAGPGRAAVTDDIADVDVGDNIGAKLQSEQADADKRVAQAKACALRTFSGVSASLDCRSW